MAAPAINSLPHMLALCAFFIPALLVSRRLHNALVNQNYPLK
jgi:hypothetical protein